MFESIIDLFLGWPLPGEAPKGKAKVVKTNALCDALTPYDGEKNARHRVQKSNKALRRAARIDLLKEVRQ